MKSKHLLYVSPKEKHKSQEAILLLLLLLFYRTLKINKQKKGVITLSGGIAIQKIEESRAETNHRNELIQDHARTKVRNM